ncbi:ankyrin repeat and SOCS box protein 18 [Callorhinchus milii]|uniref:ankyrin repeat and SOCS box protein 18 n=1 Tax=Callorhinchus milii TaxID=7868 RepID=UPI0004574E6A|nr:ankyrin repeat and SOCS box protein 18 [Callorhinchus milii]|eukprot:gi/632975148/ref/XP_007904065.1/ PREDICTED: ankyrin repeat and SOCS box protein 18 [Callorhinchus milii]
MQSVSRPEAAWIPNHTLASQFVWELKRALEAQDHNWATGLLQAGVKLPNATIELSNDDWINDPSAVLHLLVLLGLWSLEYKRELTSPLCIAATYGYTDCLRHILQCGAEVNLVPGPRSALQQACANAHPHCVQLLLEHGANPRLLSEEGLTSLHLCDSPHSFLCAKLLLSHQADINQLSDEEGTSPLHVAAEHGLVEHVLLYLRYGAKVDRVDSRGQTPLGSACAQPQSSGSQEAYHQVCQLLMTHGADVNAVDGERATPLHRAARNANHALVQLLLQHHADVNAIDYNGSSPLRCALQSAVLKQELQPQCTVQTLLNHGSHRVWPGAFIKVLKSCAVSPQTIEVLFNSYQQIQVTEEWPEVVPEDILQVHWSFYKSLFALASRPRSLQHLCRFAARKLCGDQCQAIIPTLPVPRCLHGYLLLEPQGWVF